MKNGASILIGLMTCLVASGLGWAADSVDQAIKSVPAAGGHDAAGHDKSKMWQSALTREPLAATARFDKKGRLWRASVKEGRVLVSFSDDKGNTFSTPVQVNATPEFVAADGENRPKLLLADNGNIYVSYTQSLETPFTGNIRFSRSVDGGKSFSPPITVNDNHDVIAHRFDSMGINKRGQIYLAWLDKRDAAIAKSKGEVYTGLAVYYAVSRDQGKSFSANIKLADHSCECCRIGMAVDKDDTPVIVWRHVFGKNIRDHALQRLDGKSPLQRLSEDNWAVDACPHHGPAISIAGDGLYHTVWFSNAPEQRGLFYAQSSNQGKSFSEPLPFGNFDAQASHPDVLSLGRQVFIVWKEFDGEANVIYRVHSRDHGKSWSQPTKIASTAGNADYPLLVNKRNEVFVSWNTVEDGYYLIKPSKIKP